MIVKLTSDFIANNLRCPEGKRRIEYVDTGGTGLYIEARATSPGQGTYYLRYKDANNKTCHQKIGRTTDIDLDEARRRAKTLKAEITLGADPRAEENAKKAIPTFSEFMDEMYFPHVRTRKRTAAKDEEYFRLRLKAAFGHKRLNQISRREVQLFHSALHDEGLAPATCNHYIKLLKRALNLAIQWEIVDMKNPCGIQLYRELNLVENYMDDEQLQRLLTVLNTDKNRTVCSTILFLLSTGARLNEALQAKWEYIDVEHRVWRIPAQTAKAGKMRAVPLNDTSLEVLSMQSTKDDEYEHVFINRQTEKPYTTIQKVWNRLRNAAGLGHVRIHDLRHQYASFLVNNGATLYTTGQILGHSTPKVTQRYAHLSTATLQDAAATAAEQINNAMKKTA